MRRLKRRQPADRMHNEIRQTRLQWTKWLYLITVAGFFLWLAHLFILPHFFLNAGGLILAEKTTIATEFHSTVRTLSVKEFTNVRAGETVAQISSHQVTQALAELSTQAAQVRIQLAELETRQKTIAALEPMTKERAVIAADVRKQLDKLTDMKVLPLDRRISSFENYFRGQQDLTTLRAEGAAIEEQLDVLRAVVERSEDALAELQIGFSNGNINSAATGIVSRLYVSEGAVIRPGDPIMDIHSGERYVLAYLPKEAFFDVKPGKRVRVRYGVKTLPARIERIEPIAATLPLEFQKVFKPVERGQVMRIVIDGPPPPLHAAVEVLSLHWPPAWLD
jgi:multidrug resistance efflux pump